MRKVLVTGGNGFIGSALVKKLLHNGYAVRVLDDNSRGNPQRLKAVASDIEFVAGDVRDADKVSAAMKGVDVVAHLAFVNGTEFFYTKPDLVLEVGVKGALNTVESAIKHSVPEYWLMSSSEVYQTPASVPTDETVPLCIPDPLNPRYSYGGGKLISELMVLNYGIHHFEKCVVVRPHNVFGPDMGWEHVIPQFALRAKAGVAQHPGSGPVPFLIQGEGTQSRSFVYIDDFTDGCFLAYTRGQHREIYHVGTMQEKTIGELAQEVMRCFGREAQLIPGNLPKGGTTRRCPDIRKVAALGYQPKISLENGLALTIPWYVENSELAPEQNPVSI